MNGDNGQGGHDDLFKYIHDNYYPEKDYEKVKAKYMSSADNFKAALHVLYMDKHKGEDYGKFMMDYAQKYGHPFLELEGADTKVSENLGTPAGIRERKKESPYQLAVTDATPGPEQLTKEQAEKQADWIKEHADWIDKRGSLDTMRTKFAEDYTADPRMLKSDYAIEGDKRYSPMEAAWLFRRDIDLGIQEAFGGEERPDDEGQRTVSQYENDGRILYGHQKRLLDGAEVLAHELKLEYGDDIFDRYEKAALAIQQYNASSNGMVEDEKNTAREALQKQADALRPFQDDKRFQEYREVVKGIDANVARINDFHKDPNNDLAEEYLKEIEAERKKREQEMEGMSFLGKTNRYSQDILMKSMAKAIAMPGMLAGGVKSIVGSEDYTAIDAVADFSMDLVDDVEFALSPPSKLSRPLVTRTAIKDIDGERIQADKEDGQIMFRDKDGNLIEPTEELKQEFGLAEYKDRYNWSTLPYKIASVGADLGIQIFGTKGFGKAFSFVGKAPATYVGSSMTVAGLMMPGLYKEGLKAMDGDRQKAMQYAMTTGLAIGVVNNIFGLETRLANGTKGLLDTVKKAKLTPATVAATQGSINAMNFAKAKVAQIATAGGKEALEETVIEKLAQTGVQYFYNGMAGARFDTQPFSDKAALFEEALISFAVGTTASSFEGGVMNDMVKAGYVAALENPDKFQEILEQTIDQGIIDIGLTDNMSEDAKKDLKSKYVGREHKIVAEAAKSMEIMEGVTDADKGEVAGLLVMKERLGIDHQSAKEQGLDVVADKLQTKIDAINEELGKFVEQEAQPEENRGTDQATTETTEEVATQEEQTAEQEVTQEVPEITQEGQEIEPVAETEAEPVETEVEPVTTTSEEQTAEQETPEELPNQEEEVPAEPAEQDAPEVAPKEPALDQEEIKAGLPEPAPEQPVKEKKKKVPGEKGRITGKPVRSDINTPGKGESPYVTPISRRIKRSPDGLVEVVSRKKTKEGKIIIAKKEDGTLQEYKPSELAKMSTKSDDDIAAMNQFAGKVYGDNEMFDDLYFRNKRMKDMFDPQSVTDWIADAFLAGVRITPDSFKNASDPNYVKDSPGIRLNYLAEREKGGERIDILAEEIADRFNADSMDIQEQIVQFMLDHPSSKTYVRQRILDEKKGYRGDMMFEGMDMDGVTDEQAEQAFNETISAENYIAEMFAEEEELLLEEIYDRFADENGAVDAEAVLNWIETEINDAFVPDDLAERINNTPKVKELLNEYAEKNNQPKGEDQPSVRGPEPTPGETTETEQETEADRAARETKDGIDEGGDTSGFIKAGFFAFEISIPKKVKRWIRKFAAQTFTSYGLLPKEVFDANIVRTAEINAIMRDIDHMNRDLKSAIKKAYGREATEEELKAMNNYLATRGRRPVPTMQLQGGIMLNSGALPPGANNNLPQGASNIPMEVRKVLDIMRDKIDALSREMILSGIVDGPLTLTLLENLGTYINRSYRIHDKGQEWIDEVEKLPVFTTAVDYLTRQTDQLIDKLEKQLARKLKVSQAGLAQLDLQNLYNKLRRGLPGTTMNESAAKTYERLLQFKERRKDIPAYAVSILKDQLPTTQMVKQSKLGAKDFSILQKRKDIPKEIRDLFGEYENPSVNYAQSVMKMIHIIKNHDFLEKVKAVGMDKFLFREPRGEFNHKLTPDGSKIMAPLSGAGEPLYTTSEVKEAFEKFEDLNEISDWLVPFVWFTSKAKYAKTILSPVTHVRNFLGNIYFHTANGRWGFAQEFPRAHKLIMQDLRGSDERSRQTFKKLISLGVVYDSSTYGEMRELMKDVEGNQFDEFLKKIAGDFLVKGVDTITKATEKAYQAEDDIHKVVAFYMEAQRYAQALFGQDLEQLQGEDRDMIERKAAAIVRNTMPTYSLVPRNLQRLRRNPFIATFVSFPAEMLRTTVNTVRLATEEIKNPATRSIGIQRGLGFAMTTAIPPILSAMFHYFTGMTDDEDRVRSVVAPWSEDSILFPVSGVDERGNWTYVDMTSMLPSGYQWAIINSMFDTRETPLKNIQDAAWNTMDPFIGIDMLTQKLDEVRLNQKAGGGKVYFDDALPIDRFYSIAEHVSEALEPGAVTTGRRLIKSFTDPTTSYGQLHPEYELLALAGIRVTPSDIYTSFRFKSSDLAERKRSSKSPFYYANREVERIKKGAEGRGLTENEKMRIEKEYAEGARQSEYMWNKVFKETIQLYQDVRQLGRKDPLAAKKLWDLLRDNGFNQREIDYISVGEIPPIQFKRQ